MSSQTNGKLAAVWKWIATSLVALLAAALSGSWVASSAVHDHSQKPGHQVMVERVNRIEQEIHRRLQRIETKLDNALRR